MINENPLKVWVVSANDYVDSVFATYALALEYMERRRATQARVPLVYWEARELPVISARE